MRIEKFVFGPVGTNCYIVINEMTSECFAVDMADCPQEFVKHIKDAGLCVKALLLTHGHFDHIMGAERFAEIFGCPVYAYEGANSRRSFNFFIIILLVNALYTTASSNVFANSFSSTSIVFSIVSI